MDISTGEEQITLTQKQLRSIVKDSAKSAEAVNLVYVSDAKPGIVRVKKNGGFEYFFKGQKVKDDEVLLRIKHLVLPPAWEKVWICPNENGHLQATGWDVKNRKQYKYHPLWNTLRNHTKFYRLHEFGKALPAIRLKLEKHITLPGLPVNKVLATVVSLMERTHIRIGNSFYEKLYGSFGLTTLKDKHVKIKGTNIRFSFVGKKGVYHDIDIKSRRLANIVKSCRDIPGKELFQFIGENSEKRTIDSGMVNEYIKNISGGDFTAKDFRTWAGTVQGFLAFKELGSCQTATETKKKIVEALDIVSHHLGNTRTVCKKYYVHPSIISLYENKDLDKYINQLDKIEKDDDKSSLTPEEKIVMKIVGGN